MSRLILSGFYHNIVKNLAPIEKYLQKKGHKGMVVDGGTPDPAIPIKAAAVKAGMGWIGKNTLLNSQKYGTYRALGAILTDADLHEEYERAESRCVKTCTRCLDACPVQALHAPWEIEKLECLSYILGKEQMELEKGTNSDGYFFECEICQNICPWNQKHIQQPLDTPYGRLHEPLFEQLRSTLKVEHLFEMDEETYLMELRSLIAGGEKLSYSLFERNIHTLLKDRRTEEPTAVQQE